MVVIREIPADEILKSSLNGLRDFLESSTRPAAVTKSCGRLILSNGELIEFLPHLKSATAGQAIFISEAILAIADKSCRATVGEQLDDAVRRASESSVPEQLLLRCSSKVSLLVAISPQIREGGKPDLLWVLRDVGKDHRLEERDQHSRKMQTLTRFAGGMAHEFNNLLTAILGNLELMRVQPAQPIESVISNIDSAEVAALRASALIQELRRFGTREIPVREPKFVPQSLRRAGRILSGTVSKNIEITHACDNEAQLYALINADQLEQVILKLGVNSAEAIGSAEGRIHIYAGSFTDESGKPVIRIDISDTGHGMCELTREQAFEPLFTTREEAKAAGLGMSIAHGLIEEMGGHIRISETSSRGSVVSVFLPRIESTESADEDSSVDSQISGLRIATLDNERSVRNVVSGMLSLLGHKVECFADSSELLEALENGERFDVVMIDLVMPGMTGRATYTKVRRIDGIVPVIVCSGKELNTAHFCPDCGTKPNAFLRKPFTMQELNNALASVTVGEYQI